MFDRIRKVLSKEAAPAAGAASAAGSGPEAEVTPVSGWAAAQGFSKSVQADSQLVILEGEVTGHPMRVEIGRSTRNYITGEEVRGRAELRLAEDIAVLVMNRALKEALERKAYSMITDHTQTRAEPSLPEEMRWLAMYDEVGWDDLPGTFWSRYAVMAHRREHALAWLDERLALQLLHWPQPAPGPEVPFMLLLLRGRAWLRMELTPQDPATLQHATQLFSNACEAAVGTFAGMPGVRSPG